MALSALSSIAGPAIGAISNIIGGAQSSSQAAEAAGITREQLDAVLEQLELNNQFRERLFDDALSERTFNRNLALSTRTTPESTTSYDPETGFTTTLSPQAQTLYDAFLQRQIQDIYNQQLNDAQLPDIAAQRGRFRSAADLALDEYTSGRPVNSELLGGLLARSARIGVDDAFRDSGNIASRQFVRSGGADSLAAGRTFEDLARSRSTALSQALLNARVQGITTGFNQEEQRKNNAASQALSFGQFGSQPLNIPIVNTNVGSNAGSTQQGLASGALDASSISTSALNALASPIQPYGVVEGGSVAADALTQNGLTNPAAGIVSNVGDLTSALANRFAGRNSTFAPQSVPTRSNNVATSTQRFLV